MGNTQEEEEDGDAVRFWAKELQNCRSFPSWTFSVGVFSTPRYTQRAINEHNCGKV